MVCLLATNRGSTDCEDGFAAIKAFDTKAGKQPEATLFRQALPILGTSGDLSLFGTDSPAKGKVFAKTGTQGAPNTLTGQILISSRAMAGYLDVGGGHYQFFDVVFNDAMAASTDEILTVANDIAQIAALLQEDGASGA